MQEVEECAFRASKQLMLISEVLVHYDPNLELVLSSDASSYGVGAVLSHRMPHGTEKTSWEYLLDITTTEKKCFQQGKEGLACVIGVKRFHNYLFGCHFTLFTDHKPLLSLFSEQMAISAQTSELIQRWSLTLAAYQHTTLSSSIHSSTKLPML